MLILSEGEILHGVKPEGCTTKAAPSPAAPWFVRKTYPGVASEDETRYRGIRSSSATIITMTS